MVEAVIKKLTIPLYTFYNIKGPIVATLISQFYTNKKYYLITN